MSASTYLIAGLGACVMFNFCDTTSRTVTVFSCQTQLFVVVVCQGNLLPVKVLDLKLTILYLVSSSKAVVHGGFTRWF